MFFLIIDEINKLPGEYKLEYCNEYKLLLILQFEDSYLYWNSLTKNIFYNPFFKRSNHYKGINQQYNRWCTKDVFKNAFQNYSVINNIDSRLIRKLITLLKTIMLLILIRIYL